MWLFRSNTFDAKTLIIGAAAATVMIGDAAANSDANVNILRVQGSLTVPQYHIAPFVVTTDMSLLLFLLVLLFSL